jgi:amphi-Trp domain-containing protein
LRSVADRDVERDLKTEQFVAILRRIADALEGDESVRIQVKGKRFTIPKTASLSIEHEVEGSDEELELQLRWNTE